MPIYRLLPRTPWAFGRMMHLWWRGTPLEEALQIVRCVPYSEAEAELTAWTAENSRKDAADV